jgi:exosortase family protein XrtM
VNSKPNILRVALIFFAAFLCLRFAYDSVRDTWMERLILDDLTVKSSALLIYLVSPGTTVQTQGHALIGSFGRLTVALGCEGTESILLLVAAVIAFPATWRNKLFGALLGSAILFVLNQVRIVGLFFVLQDRPQWFNALHGYLAPTGIILAAAVYFFIWTARVQSMPRATNTA